jgi:putative phosphoribosyl transferase
MTQPLPEFVENGHLYRDRIDAGARLGDRLEAYRGQGVLILGIPRGGIPVAAEVARRLDADLDIVVARKLGAPGYPELAIGAVTANGGRFLNEEVIRELSVSESYVEDITAERRAEAQDRERRFRGRYAAAPIKDRTVIVIDDGLATGATMRATVRSVRRHQPARIIVAVPVGSRQACAALRDEADEVICLSEPEDFWAVGYYYRDFQPTEDEEVLRILQESLAMRHRPKEVSG